MAYFYTYIDPAKIEAQFMEKEPEEKERRRSLEMAKRSVDSIPEEEEEEELKQTKM